MKYRREGLPNEDELCLCTVTKILHHAVFVNLDEYDKGGLVHISEIAPGRIRNIRDYVEKGKKIVCKILRVDRQKGYIDLSLRRVTDKDRKKKLEDIKQEQKAEKIVEIAAKEVGKEPDELYNQITDKVFEKYPFLHLFFKDIVAGEATPQSIGLDEKLSSVIKSLVEERFKPAKAEVKGVLEVKSYAPDGVEVVKKALSEAQKSTDEVSITISYSGGGKYRTKVEADDYKSAENALAKIEEKIKAKITDGEVSFTRA